MKKISLNVIGMLFASLLLISADVAPNEDEAQDIVTQKALEELVSKSDLILVGTVSIMATRAGHAGSVTITEVLCGEYKEKMIGFTSAPVQLELQLQRIWFLRSGGQRAGLLTTKDFSSAPVSQRQEVIRLYEKKPNRVPGSD